MLHVGFTGTRHGMTDAQESAVWRLLRGLTPFVAHHGDCVGADAQFHHMAHELDQNVIGHPGNAPTMRANCRVDECREPAEMMTRNYAIVNESSLVIAAPADDSHKGGTWGTVSIVRRLEKPLAIVMPDGSVEFERWERIREVSP